MSRRPRLACLTTLLTLAAGAAGTAALAQTPDDELLRRREQQRQAEQAQRDAAAPQSLQAAPATRQPEALPDETPCLPVRSIALDGAEPFAFLDAPARAAEGRCIGVLGLQVLQRNLQRALIERGFVTSRVLVPEQNLAAGALRLQVIPGRIDAIVEEGRTRGRLRLALPQRADGLLDQRDLDAAIENLRRLPSGQKTEIDVRPAAQPGGSELVVKHGGDKPWRGVVSLDNAGADATGDIGAAFTFTLDSPLRLYDQLSYTHNRNAQSDAAFGNRGHSLQWSAPFGHWSFTLGATRYRYLQSVAGFSGPLRYSGDSAGREMGLAWTAWRSAAAKTTLGAKFVQRQSRSFIEGTEVGVQARDAALADLSLAHRHQVDAATLDGALNVRFGLPDQSPKPGVIVGEPDFDGNWRVTQASASLALPFKAADAALTYRAQLRLQHAAGIAPTTEYFAIGNRYTVRGFDGERSLAAASGALLRQELGWALPWQAAALEAYATFDAGLVRGAGSELLAGRSLGGAGIGLRARAHGISADFALTAPWRQPDPFGPRKRALYASIAYDF